eukprot:NODE_4806_length_759_cov_18.585915_g4457_i0.p1 GENE.NODE_4806_length_759_cov_18.585915_g4457_i0~~NODE_4806_length_759_cov_18.585915_g4457_i0.p1  ORF type:complete len:156 (+),score=25.61 NODE_4806_length_759_cov_18.585915_g4457_i0:89-556(+)
MDLATVYDAACSKLRCKPNSSIRKMLVNDRNQKVLDLHSNYCGSENGFACILEVIAANTQLEHLDLSGNFLTPENVHALVNVLLKHPKCSTLRLNDNRLYIDAGKSLVRLAKNNPRIIEIDVDDQTTRNNNKIPQKIMNQLQRELTQNRNAAGSA